FAAGGAVLVIVTSNCARFPDDSGVRWRATAPRSVLRAASWVSPVSGIGFAGKSRGACASLGKWGETAHALFARETFLAHHSLSGLTNSHRMDDRPQRLGSRRARESLASGTFSRGGRTWIASARRRCSP